jgi:hypothetical protein
MKKLFLTIAVIVGGAIGGTALAWGGLIVFVRIFVVNPGGSYLDENTAPGELFLHIWFALVVLSAALAWVFFSRRSAVKKNRQRSL